MQRQLELAALHGHGVEHLVHDSRHLLGPGLDDGRELALFGRLGAGRKQARRPYHRVELVAQLVADVGKQIRIDLDQPMLMAVGALLRRRRCSDVTKFAHQ